MKSISKKLLTILLVCVFALSFGLLVACDNSDTYTVKVVDAAGNPYTGAKVQLCEVDENDQLATCYLGVATDSNGVAVLTIGENKEITNLNADEMEIHLLDLPAYLTYEAVRMHKNETATVVVKDKVPASGNGTGPKLSNGDQLDTDNNFNPYVVGEGGYKFKFTAADQWIYYQFNVEYSGVYKVYSEGSVDASVTQLLGTAIGGGIRYWDEDDYKSDNVSATDKNFSYQFEVSEEDIQQSGDDIKYATMYFVIKLENAADVNKEGIIYFEYVDDLTPGQNAERVPVQPTKPITQYSNQEGVFIDLDLDVPVEYAKLADGYYHLSSDPDSPIIVAVLGCGNVELRGLKDDSFVGIHEQGQGLFFYDKDDNKNYDYGAIITAYSDAANDDGCYPLTDELVDFFSLYIAVIYGQEQLEANINALLPEGKEWMVWCGYYEEDIYTGGDGSSEEEAIYLTQGELSITVTAGQPVYYCYYSLPEVEYTITTSDENVKLEIYNPMLISEKRTFLSSDNPWGLYAYVYGDAMSQYYFVFSSEDGKAATYTVEVDISVAYSEPDGSSDNPYEAYLGQTYGETTEMDGSSAASVYYTYVTTDEDETLYFLIGANTVIRSITYYDADLVGHQLSYDDVKTAGLKVPAETEVLIEVSTVVDTGDFVFAIYNTVHDPLGSVDNPYQLSEGQHTIAVPAGGKVYFDAWIWMGTMKYTIMSDSLNVKLYAHGVNSQSGTHEQSGLYGFDCELLLEETYIFEFSTIDGEAATYSILVWIEEQAELGSSDNPKEVEQLGEPIDDYLDNAYGEVFYKYVVAAGVSKLYFDCDENTNLMIMVESKGIYWSTADPDDIPRLAAGLSVEENDEVLIAVTRAGDEPTPGSVNFTVSDSPITK